MEAASIIAIAVLLDFLLGDPGGKYHPVALIGNLIAFLERAFYKDGASKNFLFFRGMSASLLVLFLTGLTIFVISHALNKTWAILIQAFLLSFTISTRTLAKRGTEIAQDLKINNIEGARKKLSYIVSRDTKQLKTEDVIRGTVETMAENFVDGTVAPLFWFALFGLPGAFIYRASNTLDAMYGYRNERYEYFGKFAARTDDFLNYIPARIGGIILLLAGIFLGFSARKAVRTWLKYAHTHPSPNSGIPESVIAGLLGVRLGGYNYYHGKEHFRAYLGTMHNTFKTQQIYQLEKILYTATLVYTLILVFILRMQQIPRLL